MNKFWFSLLLLILAMGTVHAQNELSIRIEGIKEVKGKMYIAVHNQESSFPGGEERFREAVAEVADRAVSWKFDDLPAAKYAISIFHDVNNNGKMDTNWVGIPKEPYGFSTNPRIVLRAPRFEECSFAVEDAKSVTIQLK